MANVIFHAVEEKVHFFERRKLNDIAFLAHIKLVKGQSSKFHYHTETRDTFYVLGGKLTVMVRLRRGESPYKFCGELRPTIKVTIQPDGGELHTFQLMPGHVCAIEPNAVHCTANVEMDVCEFLCIEGVGAYDFNEVTMAAKGIGT